MMPPAEGRPVTRRARYGDTAGQGRFPLRPGKPLVHRRYNGKWGFTCDCLTHARPERSTTYGNARHNCETWQQALREAHDHIAFWHKTPRQYETEALEALYNLPPATTRRTAP